MNHKPLQPLPPELVERACKSEDGSIAAGDRISDAEEFYLAGQRAGRAAAFAECRDAAAELIMQGVTANHPVEMFNADWVDLAADIRALEPRDE